MPVLWSDITDLIHGYNFITVDTYYSKWNLKTYDARALHRTFSFIALYYYSDSKAVT